jgi:hypothetical protein
MFTPDLFPLELAAAQRELAECHPYEPLPGNGAEASVHEPSEASESRELLAQDEKAEALERYWFWDDSEYARMVCVRRWGEI